MLSSQYYTEFQVVEIKNNYDFYSYDTNYFYKKVGNVLHRYSRTLSSWILELNRSNLDLSQTTKLNDLDFEAIIQVDPTAKHKNIAHPIEKVQLDSELIKIVENQWINSAEQSNLDQNQMSLLKNDFERIRGEQLIGDYTARLNKQTYFGLKNNQGDISTLVEVIYSINGLEPLVKLMSISHRTDIELWDKTDYHSYHAKSLGTSISILLANTAVGRGATKVYAEDQTTLEQLRMIRNGLTVEEVVDKLGFNAEIEGRFLTFRRKN